MTFRKAEYDMPDHFECMTPLQVWYIRRSGEHSYRRHLLAKSPTALGWKYEEFPEGAERLIALDFLEASEIETLDRFSQIIEAEWQKVHGAAA